MQSRFNVPVELAEERLDRVLAALVPALSRSRLQKLVRQERVRVDGEVVARPSAPVPGGSEVALELPEPTPATDVEGAPIEELSVLYEDEHLAVIDKQAGLLAHPNERSSSGSVSELARERWGPLPEVQGVDRPGIVHRLDRMTSGVMVIGRTEAALRGLQDQFRARAVEKTYVALCLGVPRFETEWVEVPIERSPKHPERRRVAKQGEGRPASTFIECAERFDGFARMHASPKSGRTHQIRVHLLHAGLPIVGDRLYRGQGVLARSLPEDAPPLHRQALHAQAIAFEHPLTGERVRFEAPLPGDLAALLEWLRRSG